MILSKDRMQAIRQDCRGRKRDIVFCAVQKGDR